MKPDTTVYAGKRIDCDEAPVTVDGRELTPDASLKLRNHSPTGFEWGYLGSGPAQLALAILLDFTGDRELALDAYQWFKDRHVARWEREWQIAGSQIKEELGLLQAEGYVGGVQFITRRP